MTIIEEPVPQWPSTRRIRPTTTARKANPPRTPGGPAQTGGAGEVDTEAGVGGRVVESPRFPEFGALAAV